jgi:hypothetical protein
MSALDREKTGRAVFLAAGQGRRIMTRHKAIGNRALCLLVR